MAARWSDEHIAASLNRMGMRTGQGKTWTAHRVSSLRRAHRIHAYRSAEKNGEWLTIRDAADLLGVSNHAIRRLIKDGVLAAEQVVPDAPYQIRASDLQNQKVVDELARKARPSCQNGKPAFNVFRYLKKRCTMTPPSSTPGDTDQHQLFRKRHPRLRHEKKNLRRTVSDKGGDAHDIMLGLAKTCMKLKLSFYEFIGARLGIPGPKIPPLASLIRPAPA